MWALGAGEVWRPAVVDGAVEAVVRQAVVDAVSTDAAVLEVDAHPGNSSEVAVMLRLAPGLTRVELEDVLARVQRELAASDVIAQRVDSLELKLSS